MKLNKKEAIKKLKSFGLEPQVETEGILFINNLPKSCHIGVFKQEVGAKIEADFYLGGAGE